MPSNLCPKIPFVLENDIALFKNCGIMNINPDKHLLMSIPRSGLLEINTTFLYVALLWLYDGGYLVKGDAPLYEEHCVNNGLLVPQALLPETKAPTPTPTQPPTQPPTPAPVLSVSAAGPPSVSALALALALAALALLGSG